MPEMQTRFTAQGLVIRSASVGENDRLITVLTREYGIIKAYVPGAKSIKSKRSAATSLLTYSSLTFSRKGDTFRITEGSVINGFFSAGASAEVLLTSQYFCELASVFGTSGVANEEFFRLILNSLHFINKEKRYPPLIKAITEFRTAVISGYMPGLVACDGCGIFEDDIMYFDISGGLLFCRECVQNTAGLSVLNKTLLLALRHIAFSDFGKLYSFTVPDESADMLSSITERYITEQTQHRFTSIELLKSVK